MMILNASQNVSSAISCLKKCEVRAFTVPQKSANRPSKNRICKTAQESPRITSLLQAEWIKIQRNGNKILEKKHQRLMLLM